VVTLVAMAVAVEVRAAELELLLTQTSVQGVQVAGRSGLSEQVDVLGDAHDGDLMFEGV
jgi:hypothetical protein